MKIRLVMCALILLSQTYARSRILKKKLSIAPSNYSVSKSQSKAPPITIWIHGTRFIRRPIFSTVFKNNPGLKLAQEVPPDYYLHQLAKSFHKTAPEVFPMKTFYIFGWSGKLRDKVRFEAAQALYKHLHEVISEYKKTYKKDPIIRIIGHSHGGNVALYLGKIKDKKNETLKIKELVLLACPVQTKTKKYIEDDMFERTYAIYSTLDMVQVLAPQVEYNVYRTKRGHLRTELKWNILSNRRFDPHPKLAQVKIKINGRALFHNEFSHQRFVSLLPHILHVINTWDVDYTHPPDTKKLLCVYTRKEQKINEKKKRVRA